MSDETTLNDIFQAAVKEELPKDDIILKLVTEGGLDISRAVREYLRLAKGAGLVMGAKERAVKIEEMLENMDLTDADIRRHMVGEIADEFDISEATAAAHLRVYADKSGIELPTVQRTSLEDMVAFVNERYTHYKEDPEVEATAVRGKVVADLQSEMGYTANSAASAYSRATRELGISTGRTGVSVPLDELVALMREHVTLGRKELTKLINEECGYAESTAGSFVTYVNFAKEWARQEVEELTT